MSLWGKGPFINDVPEKGGGGVPPKGDVIYEQKYGGPNQPYDVIYE